VGDVEGCGGVGRNVVVWCGGCGGVGRDVVVWCGGCGGVGRGEGRDVVVCEGM